MSLYMGGPGAASGLDGLLNPPNMLPAFERAYIRYQLEQNRWNVAATARAIDTAVQSLQKAPGIWDRKGRLVISRLTLADFAAHGSHQKGHFRLSSGLHSSDYLQCALFLANPVRAERAGQQLAEAMTSAMVKPDVVVGPALGGLIIGHETARAFRVRSSSPNGSTDGWH